MRKFWLYLVIIFQLGLLVSLTKGIQISLSAKNRVNELEKQKESLLAEKKRLEDEYKYVQSPEYLERVVRDELNLTKEGETIVLLPPQEVVTQQEQEKQMGPQTNWEKWVQVLFGTID